MAEWGWTMADVTPDRDREPYWRTVLARWRRIERAEPKEPAFLPMPVLADVVDPRHRDRPIKPRR
jgi:hypothetical protein